MRTWERENYKVVEKAFDGDLHEFDVITEDGEEQIITPNCIEDMENIISQLNAGEDVDGWEDGMGNTIHIPDPDYIKKIISGLNTNEEKEIEILRRSKVEKLIEDIDTFDVYKKTFEEANGYSFSGTAYTQLNVQTGKIETIWLQNGTYEHPFDSFPEVVLCAINSPIFDFEPKDLLDEFSSEYEEFQNQNDLSPEEFISKKFGDKELEERIQTAIRWYANEFELDDEKIEKQLDEIYEEE